MNLLSLLWRGAAGALLLTSMLPPVVPIAGAFVDEPFPQDRAAPVVLDEGLEGATFHELAVDHNGIVYARTDRGVARIFEDTMALDRSFRPLAGKRALDVAVADGHLFYLFEDRVLSHGEAGRFLVRLAPGRFRSFAVADSHAVLLAGPGELTVYADGYWTRLEGAESIVPKRLYAHDGRLYVMTERAVHRVFGRRLIRDHEAGEDTTLTALGFSDGLIWIGTTGGYYAVDRETGERHLSLQTRLPARHITAILPRADGVWFGTPRGVFRRQGDQIDYYASRRWLRDDHVLDLASDAGGDVLVLNRAGVDRIQFRSMTLEEKARFYERKIRQRHIRFGFCSELALATPGQIATAEMIDTDNDGTWSNYYMASQAFHFAVTGEAEARRHAWETFEAMERLEAINPLDGFPSRTFERAGFRVSDPDRWHPTEDRQWEWKAHTSSDEVSAHTFGCAVLHETTARTEAERERIARFYSRIMDHILRNDLYLVDVDGKPTLWGRWNPEYVNWYPPTIVDRRLNSAEIVAGLQFAYRITGREVYRDKAFELLEQHGYLENILSPMDQIRLTPGYVHQGNDMGDQWNHSDDLLAFVTYWVLHRYAFNDELKGKYAAAIRDHWEIENAERCPLWNFIYAATGAADFDGPGALWTLRQFPIDLISWTVQNSHRDDLTPLERNFRVRQTVELLPPDERRIMRWNGNPFILDGGNGGRSELAGDEFLLPYWMGRYLGLISKPR